jgi:ATP-dependent NAD(P)H-hydrate dehydratase
MDFKALYESRARGSRRKGDNGVVLVIGGSQIYTGAPYFSGLSSLRSGADLLYIMCTDEAVLPLKVLLPEGIILKISFEAWILKRISVCVLGPGLGRPSSSTIEELLRIIGFLEGRGVPLIVDGDGILFYYNQYISLKNYRWVILTPNYNEKRRVTQLHQKYPDSESQFIVEKGARDRILYKNMEYVVDDEGCIRRCGGLGDILTGILAALLSLLGDKRTEEDVFTCISVSCKILRESGRLAYEKKGNSVITRDVIEFIQKGTSKTLKKM